ncbi:MAG: protein-L-isoaspartate(D-aspartate) O-methyltransferase [Nitritalea sp.]
MPTFTDSYKHKGLRRALIRSIRERGIRDERVLQVMAEIPRHLFLDSAFELQAYEDRPFPIGEGQTISQPYTVAFQTSLLEVEASHKVLEIGTGSGYQATVLQLMGAEVHSIEYQEKLYTRTRQLLARFGIHPYLYQGDGSQGLPEEAPFDRILVTAGAPVVPDALLRQLAIGGILVIPVGDRERQEMLRLRRVSEQEIEQEAFPSFSFVPLKGVSGWER